MQYTYIKGQLLHNKTLFYLLHLLTALLRKGLVSMTTTPDNMTPYNTRFLPFFSVWDCLEPHGDTFVFGRAEAFLNMFFKSKQILCHNVLITVHEHEVYVIFNSHVIWVIINYQLLLIYVLCYDVYIIVCYACHWKEKVWFLKSKNKSVSNREKLWSMPAVLLLV